MDVDLLGHVMEIAPNRRGADLVIRRYQPEDADAVWVLHNRALREAGGYMGKGEWDDDLKHIEDVYLATGGEFLVGTMAEQVVAMGALKPLADGAVLVKRMRVLPEFQRRGYGQKILSLLEAIAQERGFRTIKLDTTPVQVAAVALYTKNGYQEVSRSWKNGFEQIYYEKTIG